MALFGLCTPALLLVLIIMVIPVAWLFWLSFIGDHGGFSLDNYRRLIESRSYLRVFELTFEVTILTTAVCVLIGYPLAYLLSQLRQKMAYLCMIAVLIPLWTSVLVRTYAWLVILQRRGLINSWGIDLGLWNEPVTLVHNMLGTVVGMTQIMLPFLILPAYGAMKAVNADYIKAAANLGASPTQAFWKVFFPLSLPGLFAGALIVFILCLGFYITPVILGGGNVIMVSMLVASTIKIFVNWGAASALGVVLLVLTLLILYLASRIVRLDKALGGHTS